MNQPNTNEDEKPDIPVPSDEEPPAPIREPDKKPPIEEPEPEQPKRIV